MSAQLLPAYWSRAWATEATDKDECRLIADQLDSCRPLYAESSQEMTSSASALSGMRNRARPQTALIRPHAYTSQAMRNHLCRSSKGCPAVKTRPLPLVLVIANTPHQTLINLSELCNSKMLCLSDPKNVLWRGTYLLA